MGQFYPSNAAQNDELKPYINIKFFNDFIAKTGSIEAWALLQNLLYLKNYKKGGVQFVTTLDELSTLMNFSYKKLSNLLQILEQCGFIKRFKDWAHGKSRIVFNSQVLRAGCSVLILRQLFDKLKDWTAAVFCLWGSFRQNSLKRKDANSLFFIHDKKSWFSWLQTTISEQLAISLRQLQRTIQLLKKNGVLLINRHKYDKQSRNYYHFNVDLNLKIGSKAETNEPIRSSNYEQENVIFAQDKFLPHAQIGGDQSAKKRKDIEESVKDIKLNTIYNCSTDIAIKADSTNYKHIKGIVKIMDRFDKNKPRTFQSTIQQKSNTPLPMSELMKKPLYAPPKRQHPVEQQGMYEDYINNSKKMPWTFSDSRYVKSQLELCIMRNKMQISSQQQVLQEITSEVKSHCNSGMQLAHATNKVLKRFCEKVWKEKNKNSPTEKIQGPKNNKSLISDGIKNSGAIFTIIQSDKISYENQQVNDILLAFSHQDYLNDLNSLKNLILQPLKHLENWLKQIDPRQRNKFPAFLQNRLPIYSIEEMEKRKNDTLAVLHEKLNADQLNILEKIKQEFNIHF